jgi:diacylglycerol kinase family enzyme
MDGELLPLERDVALRLHPGELRVLVKQGLAAQVDESERREPAS